jgi:hypothetical protein
VSSSASTSQPSLFCGRCGYDLRGLARDANCPECGTPLARSLYGDYLRHQNPRWLRRLFRGALWSVIAQAGWLGVTGYWLARHGSYDWNVLLSSPVSGIAMPILLTALNLVAVVYLTSPAPGAADSLFSPRRALRVFTPVMASMTLMGYLPALREPPVFMFWLGFGSLQAALSLVWGLFLGGIALRIPNWGLALETVLAAAGAALLQAILDVYPLVLHVGAVRFGWNAALPPVAPLQIAGWAIAGYSLVLLVRYYLALAACVTAEPSTERACGA